MGAVASPQTPQLLPPTYIYVDMSGSERPSTRSASAAAKAENIERAPLTPEAKRRIVNPKLFRLV